MRQYQEQIHIPCRGRGMYEITLQVRQSLETTSIKCGMFTLFLGHTSCSLMLHENNDMRARHDLEKFLSTLIPDGKQHYAHSDEGPDDMPSHIRATLTNTSINIPIRDGKMVLGSWQGIFLYEHRLVHQRRKITLHLVGQ